MSTHIDTLNEWWDNAEEGTAHAGDTVIRREGENVYQVYTLDVGPIGKWGDIRILARAPKPKPAWHDAKAVTAVTKKHPEFRDVWVSECGEWRNVDGDFIDADDLRDVTPMIEAKVTDEMRDRVRDYYRTEHQVELPRDDAWLNDLLTVALGIDPSA